MTIDEEYKGCRNCKYQPEPLTTCDWLRHQNEVHKICPMWKLKESECKKMVGEVTERTLGEAIVEYREKAEYFKTTTKVAYGLKLEQLADWLEELSRRRVEELFRKTDEKAIRDKTIDDFQEWIKTQIVGLDTTKNEILIAVDDRWELAIDKFKERVSND